MARQRKIPLITHVARLRDPDTPDSLVWRLLDIMATAVQNNPQSQQLASDLRIMEAVFPLLKHACVQVLSTSRD